MENVLDTYFETVSGSGSAEISLISILSRILDAAILFAIIFLAVYLAIRLNKNKTKK